MDRASIDALISKSLIVVDPTNPLRQNALTSLRIDAHEILRHWPDGSPLDAARHDLARTLSDYLVVGTGPCAERVRTCVVALADLLP